MKTDHSALHKTHSAILNGPGTKADKSRALYAAGVTQKARISELLGGYSVGAIANALAVKEIKAIAVVKQELMAPVQTSRPASLQVEHTQSVLKPFIELIKRSAYTVADDVEFFEEEDEEYWGVSVYEGKGKTGGGRLKIEYGTDRVWWIPAYAFRQPTRLKTPYSLRDILGIRF